MHAPENSHIIIHNDLVNPEAVVIPLLTPSLHVNLEVLLIRLPKIKSIGSAIFQGYLTMMILNIIFALVFLSDEE
ncbi:hypothetical protein GLAREA_09037 [Glarea lozoyensis ATCC 20868]|uniref:Uncharacterized protein n=1 Tax=Glarea lozoyensis (strain ATCC 20868 / MF5171) TaxID=1116229 RepID=S3DIA3_GLAL2|nr:uncharacterized protein GLAREA_09037 [Glarea lozoyensis ATCC 20868]EPE36874.1 hypothetical protein GLAREA_09037 [Glarea lozoyensis ATCC 20868]